MCAVSPVTTAARSGSFRDHLARYARLGSRLCNQIVPDPRLVGVPPVSWTLDRWAVWLGSEDQISVMPAPYPLAFRQQAVRLLRTSGKPVPQLAAELGVSPQSLRNWSRQLDIDEGNAQGLSSDERDELRRLRREVRDAHRGARDLQTSGGLLRQGRRDPVSVFGSSPRRRPSTPSRRCAACSVSRGRAITPGRGARRRSGRSRTPD